MLKPFICAYKSLTGNYINLYNAYYYVDKKNLKNVNRLKQLNVTSLYVYHNIKI